METNDPALTKTPIGSHNALGEMVENTTHKLNTDEPVNQDMANQTTDRKIAGENVTHEEPLRKALVNEELAKRDVLSNNHANNQHNDNNSRAGGSAIVNDDVANMTRDRDEYNHEKIEKHTSTEKGTETLDDDIVHSEHVNDGDNPARQPDRRDQQGSTAFDEGINDETVGSSAPKSEGLTDMNRYANVDNAQTRILNPDEKD